MGSQEMDQGPFCLSQEGCWEGTSSVDDRYFRARMEALQAVGGQGLGFGIAEDWIHLRL